MKMVPHRPCIQRQNQHYHHHHHHHHHAKMSSFFWWLVSTSLVVLLIVQQYCIAPTTAEAGRIVGVVGAASSSSSSRTRSQETRKKTQTITKTQTTTTPRSKSILESFLQAKCSLNSHHHHDHYWRPTDDDDAAESSTTLVFDAKTTTKTATSATRTRRSNTKTIIPSSQHDNDDDDPTTIEAPRSNTANTDDDAIVRSSSSRCEAFDGSSTIWVYDGTLTDPIRGEIVSYVQGLELIYPLGRIVNKNPSMKRSQGNRSKSSSSTSRVSHDATTTIDNDDDDNYQRKCGSLMISKSLLHPQANYQYAETFLSRKLFCYTTPPPSTTTSTTNPSTIMSASSSLSNSSSSSSSTFIHPNRHPKNHNNSKKHIPKQLLRHIRLRPNSPQRIIPLDQSIVSYDTIITYIDPSSCNNNNQHGPNDDINPMDNTIPQGDNNNNKSPINNNVDNCSNNNIKPKWIVHVEWPNGKHFWTYINPIVTKLKHYQLSNPQNTYPMGTTRKDTDYNGRSGRTRWRRYHYNSFHQRNNDFIGDIEFSINTNPMRSNSRNIPNLTMSSLVSSTSHMITRSPPRSTLIQWGSGIKKQQRGDSDDDGQQRLNNNGIWGAAHETYHYSIQPSIQANPIAKSHSSWYQRNIKDRMNRIQERLQSTKEINNMKKNRNDQQGNKLSCSVRYARYGEGPVWYGPNRICTLDLRGRRIDYPSQMSPLLTYATTYMIPDFMSLISKSNNNNKEETNRNIVHHHQQDQNPHSITSIPSNNPGSNFRDDNYNDNDNAVMVTKIIDDFRTHRHRRTGLVFLDSWEYDNDNNETKQSFTFGCLRIGRQYRNVALSIFRRLQAASSIHIDSPDSSSSLDK